MGKQKILNEVQIKENNKLSKLTNIEVETINGGGFWEEFMECFRVKRKEIVYEKMNNNSFLI